MTSSPASGRTRCSSSAPARPGSRSARFCAERGAQVTVTDSAAAPSCTAAREQLGDRVDVGARQAHRRRSFLEADLIVVSPGVPDIEPLQVARKKGVRVTGEIELAAEFIQAPIVGVTGTNGKSTVTALAGEIARQTGTADLRRRQPGHAAHHRGRHAGGDARGHLVVVELSSFQLETVEKLHPRAAALLNLTPDHLDRYPASMDLRRGQAQRSRAQPRRRRRRGRQRRRSVLLGARGERLRKRTRVRTFSPRRARDDNRRAIDGCRRRAASWSRSASAIPIGELQPGRPAQPRQRARRHPAHARQRARHLRPGARGAGGVPPAAASHAARRREARRSRFYDDSKATNVDSVVAGARRLPDAVRAHRRRARQGRLVRAAGAARCATIAAARWCSSARRPTRSTARAAPTIRRTTEPRRARDVDGGGGRARRRARAAGRRGGAVAGVQLLRHVRQLRASRPRLRGAQWRRYEGARPRPRRT